MDELIRAHRGAIPAAHWEHIGPFVLAVVADLHMPTVRKTKNYFTAVTAHVYWCWQALGMDLDRQQIFQLDVIARFIDGGCRHYADSTKASYRSRLSQVARQLLTGPSRPIVLRSYGKYDNASAPYTPSEVDHLDFWARHQRTEYRSINASVVLALCFGAGLTPAEVIALQARDVHVDAEGVVLNVEGKRPRCVPMLARWEGLIADLATSALRDDQYLFSSMRTGVGSPNLVNCFLGECTDPPTRLVPQRMRSTWIVGHLEAGVPPNVLLDASGIVSGEGLARYTKFVPHLDGADIRSLLRRGRAS